jgi:hypothetical protein
MLIFTGTVFAAENKQTVPVWPQIYTLQAYDTANTYALLGGVTMVTAGTSTMTQTASGQWANTADHRTIDLRSSTEERGARTFVISLGSAEDTHVSGQFSGVTLSRSSTHGGDNALLVYARVKFSPVDSAAYWTGASYYQVAWYSGTSREPKVLIDAKNSSRDQVAAMRYMRIDCVSGTTPIRNPYMTLTVWPQ